MRPKKRIFIIDTNENRQALLRFLLQTHGYRVFAASSVEEASEEFEDCSPDLIVAAFGIHGLQLLLDRMRELNPFIPSLLLARSQASCPVGVVADVVLFGAVCTSEQIVSRVKVLSARKRGPRPGFKMPVQSATPEVSAERRSA